VASGYGLGYAWQHGLSRDDDPQVTMSTCDGMDAGVIDWHAVTARRDARLGTRS
jgi:hypothetical protein